MKKIESILYLICLLVFIQGITGCKSLRKVINKKFPPVSYTEIQCSSIIQSSSNIADIKPSVGIHIEKQFLEDNLKGFIQKEISEIKSTEFEIRDQKINVELVNQGIKANIEFDMLLIKSKIELKGNLEGYVWVSSKDENIILKGTFKDINFKSLKVLKKSNLGKVALANLISNILNNYIENINGLLEKKSYTINTGWGKLYQLELDKILKSNKTKITSKPISISRFIEKNSIRINHHGISVIGQFSKIMIPEKPETEQILKNPNGTKKKNCQKEFEIFDKKFETIWVDNFEKINPEANLVANISKLEFSKIINEVLANKIELSQDFEIPNETFNVNIEAKKENIDCSRVKTEFSFPEFSFPEFSFPEFKGLDCNFGCKWYDVPCKGAEAACRLTKKTEELAYKAARESARITHQTARESARITHQTARESARIAHQGENNVKEAACVAKRELTGFLDLGVFKGNVSGSGKCNIAINSFSIHNDLSKVDINYEASAQVGLNSYIELNPQDLGYMFLCYSSYNSKTNSKIDLNVPQNSPSFTVSNYRDGDNLKIGFKLNSLPFNAEIDKSPLHELLIDPELRLKCPYMHNVLLIGSTSTAIASLLKIIKLKPEIELLLLGKVKGNFDIDQIEISVKPIAFEINEQEQIKSIIYWNEKSIKFESLK